MTATLVGNTELPFELMALSKAVRYQKWVYDTIEQFLGKRILEFGSGIGNMSKLLPVREKLVLTELDSHFVQILKDWQLERSDPRISVEKLDINGSLDFLGAANFDTIISFNVLEHIENDKDVLRNLAALLRDSAASGPKRLITFVPAHEWAFGTMDKSFGHFRRYSRESLQSLAELIAPDARTTTRYFNTFGLLGWLVQGKLLQRPSIGMGSIATFEALCPVLASFDDLLHNVIGLPVGQSVLSVTEWT